LRQDLRHIQPDDLKMIRSTFQTPLNVELAVHANLDALFQHVIPSTVTLVPEHPHEVTTEGGLQVNFDPAALGVALKTLKKRRDSKQPLCRSGPYRNPSSAIATP